MPTRVKYVNEIRNSDQPGISSIVRIGRIVRPDPRATAAYDQYYPVYRRLYERNAEEMHELARLSTIQPARSRKCPERSNDVELGSESIPLGSRCENRAARLSPMKFIF